MPSKRNKTMVLSEEEITRRLCSCVPPCDVRSDSVVFGDLFETAKFLPPRSVDLMIADPPYNLTKNYAGRVFGRMKDEDYAGFTAAWLDAVLPALKPTASVYVCCDWKSGLTIAPLLASRLVVRNRISWQREKGRGAAKNWKNGMEDVWFCTVGDEYFFDLDAVKQRKHVLAPYRENGAPKDWTVGPDGEKYRMTCPSNFWDDVTVPYWSMSENTPHPTQKPEKLFAKLVLASSREGDLVLDPFAGTGTSAAVAVKLGRHYIAVEREREYCALADLRVERAHTDKRIQGFENGVFLPRNPR